MSIYNKDSQQKQERNEIIEMRVQWAGMLTIITPHTTVQKGVS